MRDLSNGINADPPFITGLTLNPQANGSEHFISHCYAAIKYQHTPQRFLFSISDTDGSVTQDVVVDNINRVASRVIDRKSGEVLLGCRDIPMAGLDQSWSKIPQFENYPCGPGGIFTTMSVLPEKARPFLPSR